MAGGHLLLLSHGYLGDIGRRPAMRGKHDWRWHANRIAGMRMVAALAWPPFVRKG